MKKLIIIIFLAAQSASFAQFTNELQEAFSASYNHESSKSYTEAINDIMPFYNPSSYEINVRLGWLHYYDGNYPKSMEYYEKAMQLMPYSIEAKLGYALPLSGLGNWDRIIEIYHQILKTDPQNTLVNYRLGAIYYERAEFEKAKNHTEKVVNLYPFDYDSVILLAWINLKMEDYRKAKILFNKSLIIAPENESAIEGLKAIQ